MKALLRYMTHRFLCYLSSAILATLLASGVIASEDTAPALHGTILLSDTEKAWLSAHPTLMLALDEVNPPMNFLQSDGTFAGLNVDYAQLIAKKAGLRVEFRGSIWAEALRRAMAHEVDGVMGARVKEDRKAFLNFSESYLEVPIAMATRANFRPVKVLSDFAGARVAIVRNTVRIPVVQKQCPSCKIVEVDSPHQGLEWVESGQADAFFDDLPVVKRAIEVDHRAELGIPFLYFHSEAAVVRVALRNDAPELLGIVNKALADFTPEEHEAIRKKWMSLPEAANVQRELPLGEDELGWLRTNKAIRVGIQSNAAPLEWIEADGTRRGISFDYLQRIEEMLGRRFELVRADSAPQLQQMLESHVIDAVTSFADTPQNRALLTFTDDYINSSTGIFSSPRARHFSDLSALKGQKVALVAGDALNAVLATDWPGITVVRVNSIQDGIGKVRSAEVAAFLGPMLSTSHYLADSAGADIQIAGEVPFTYRIGIGIQKDEPILASILSKAVNAISAADRSAFQHKWVAIHYAHGTDYRLLRWLGGALALGLLFILQLRRMVDRRTAQLRQEVDVRRQREEELERSEQRVRVLVDHAPEAIVVVDLDARRIVDVNPKAMELFGRSRAVLLETPLTDLYAKDQPGDQSLAESMTEHNQRALAGKEVVFERNIRTADGVTLPCEVRLVRLPAGERRLMRGSFTDITERKMTQEAINALNNTLEARVAQRTEDLQQAIEKLNLYQTELVQSEKLAALGAMVAGVAHELNTPIGNCLLASTTISHNVREIERAMEQGMTRTAMANFLRNAAQNQEIIERNLARAAELVSSFKQVAVDRTTSQRRSFKLLEVVTETLVTVSPQFHRQHYVIAQHIPDTIVLDSYPGPCGQVLTNLINNAVIHGFGERGTGHIDISAVEEGGVVRITVSDDGVGIADDVQSRIFEPFFTTRMGRGGSGLGLHIVHNLVTSLLGGRIACHSEVGRGSTFTITMPCVAPG